MTSKKPLDSPPPPPSPPASSGTTNTATPMTSPKKPSNGNSSGRSCEMCKAAAADDSLAPSGQRATLCKSCAHKMRPLNCSYCRREFLPFTTAPPPPNTPLPCERCQHALLQNPRPGPCMWCRCQAAFIGKKCDQCRKEKKKNGGDDPHACLKCGRMAAFGQNESCWICLADAKKGRVFDSLIPTVSSSTASSSSAAVVPKDQQQQQRQPQQQQPHHRHHHHHASEDRDDTKDRERPNMKRTSSEITPPEQQQQQQQPPRQTVRMEVFKGVEEELKRAKAEVTELKGFLHELETEVVRATQKLIERESDVEDWKAKYESLLAKQQQ